MDGILFKSDMIKAIAQNRKTQTRRLIQKQLPDGIDRWVARDGVVKFYHGDSHLFDFDQKPRYRVGEVVYIKEAIYRRGSLAKYGEKRADAARYHIKILSVEPELFRLMDMTPQDIEAEGGEPALKLLRDYDGKWVWDYGFELVKGDA